MLDKKATITEGPQYTSLLNKSSLGLIYIHIYLDFKLFYEQSLSNLPLDESRHYGLFGGQSQLFVPFVCKSKGHALQAIDFCSNLARKRIAFREGRSGRPWVPKSFQKEP